MDRDSGRVTVDQSRDDEPKPLAMWSNRPSARIPIGLRTPGPTRDNE